MAPVSQLRFVLARCFHRGKPAHALLKCAGATEDVEKGFPRLLPRLREILDVLDVATETSERGTTKVVWFRLELLGYCERVDSALEAIEAAWRGEIALSLAWRDDCLAPAALVRGPRVIRLPRDDECFTWGDTRIETVGGHHFVSSAGAAKHLVPGDTVRVNKVWFRYDLDVCKEAFR